MATLMAPELIVVFPSGHPIHDDVDIPPEKYEPRGQALTPHQQLKPAGHSWLHSDRDVLPFVAVV